MRRALVLAVPFVAATAPCPPGHVADAVRERALHALVAAAPEASRVPLPRACFAPGAPNVLQGGVARLDATAPDVALAARLAHLGVHAADGLLPAALEAPAATRASEERGAAVERAVLAAHPGAIPSVTSTP